MPGTTFLQTEQALAKIVQAFAPVLGQTMAAAAVEMHRQKIGLDGALLTEKQLDELLHRLGTGLIIFVGREKSEQIVREAREAAMSKESGQ
jgi:hypothetical protein